jgi:hypothetical protein
MQRYHNLSHLVVAIFGALIASAQGICEILHRAGVDTGGADWRLLGLGGGLTTISMLASAVSNVKLSSQSAIALALQQLVDGFSSLASSNTPAPDAGAAAATLTPAAPPPPPPAQLPAPAGV